MPRDFTICIADKVRQLNQWRARAICLIGSLRVFPPDILKIIYGHTVLSAGDISEHLYVLIYNRPYPLFNDLYLEVGGQICRMFAKRNWFTRGADYSRPTLEFSDYQKKLSVTLYRENSMLFIQYADYLPWNSGELSPDLLDRGARVYLTGPK